MLALCIASMLEHNIPLCDVMVKSGALSLILPISLPMLHVHCDEFVNDSIGPAKMMNGYVTSQWYSIL